MAASGVAPSHLVCAGRPFARMGVAMLVPGRNGCGSGRRTHSPQPAPSPPPSPSPPSCACTLHAARPRHGHWEPCGRGACALIDAHTHARPHSPTRTHAWVTLLAAFTALQLLLSSPPGPSATPARYCPLSLWCRGGGGARAHTQRAQQRPPIRQASQGRLWHPPRLSLPAVSTLWEAGGGPALESVAA